MADALRELLAARTGHFQFESGHHGTLWLDIDTLFLRPGRLRGFTEELATRLSVHTVEVVCGPLTGGAFVAQLIAAALDVEFCYAERLAPAQRNAVPSVHYRIPDIFRDNIRGKRVAIVDDVINAGSAVRATTTDLEACGATLAAIGALLVLGDAASCLAADQNVPLESIAWLPNELWEPARCPLCAAGIPLDTVVGPA